MKDATALENFHAVPRLHLAKLPSPVRRMPRLAEALDMPGGELFAKLDAETGFALGGNKVRKLEYVLAPNRLEGVTRLVTAGGPQSNHCRVTAAAAAHLGLPCTLVLNGPEPDPPTGNALLHRLLGAEIVTVDAREDRDAKLAALADELTASGENPLIVPLGASTGLGCLGYVRTFIELVAQLEAERPAPKRTVMFVPSSSGGTLAGMILGMALMDRRDVTLIGVSADAPATELRDTALAIAAEGAAIIGLRADLSAADVLCVDDQVGDGYGVPTEASTAALGLFARTEGLILDPTYTAKAAAGLVARVGGGGPEAGQRVVFVHTGGHPALLA